MHHQVISVDIMWHLTNKTTKWLCHEKLCPKIMIYMKSYKNMQCKCFNYFELLISWVKNLLHLWGGWFFSFVLYIIFLKGFWLCVMQNYIPRYLEWIQRLKELFKLPKQKKTKKMIKNLFLAKLCWFIEQWCYKIKLPIHDQWNQTNTSQFLEQQNKVDASWFAK